MTLPSCEINERSVIGSCLVDPIRIDEVSPILKPGDFLDDRLGVMFTALLEMRSAGFPIDCATFGAYLDSTGRFAASGGVTAILAATQLIDMVAASDHAAYHAKIVREKSRRRQSIQQVERLRRAAQDETKPLDEVLKMIDGTILDLLDSSSGEDRTAAEILEEFDQIDVEQSRLMTGFAELDGITGGMKSGELIVIAARPSVGKTAFAGQIVMKLAECGHAALAISLEMPSKSIISRMLSQASGVPHTLLKSPERSGEVNAARHTIRKLPIRVSDREASTVGDVSALARRRARSGELDLLVVDYLQLLVPEEKRLVRAEQVAIQSRTLKRLARFLGVPVVALSQLNRSIESRENKKPQLSDLRESGAIEQDADQVWFLDRPGKDSGKPDDCLTVSIKKNRNGPLGTVTLGWDPLTMRVFEPNADYQFPSDF